MKKYFFHRVKWKIKNFWKISWNLWKVEKFGKKVWQIVNFVKSLKSGKNFEKFEKIFYRVKWNIENFGKISWNLFKNWKQILLKVWKVAKFWKLLKNILPRKMKNGKFLKICSKLWELEKFGKKCDKWSIC